MEELTGINKNASAVYSNLIQILHSKAADIIIRDRSSLGLQKSHC